MRVILVLASWLLVVPALGQDGKEQDSTPRVAITFDKLPYMEPLGFWAPREVGRAILRTLEEYSAPATGFVVEEKIVDRPETVAVLEDWIAAGHQLGNNTWGYVDLNEVDEDEFWWQTRDGLRTLRRFVKLGVEPILFRFPMLHEGSTPGKKHRVAYMLRRAGYVSVPATVFFEDYEFNFVLRDIENEPEKVSRLRGIYLAAFEGALSYAERQAEAVFGRPVAQILRLHPGIATAQFLDGVLATLRHKGYEFVTVQEALEDSAYQEVEDYVGPLGLSFIDRVAATRGLPFDPDQGRLSRREITAILADADAPEQ
ncbi:MAG: polysaccharide deacetylase family protein [Acidobacteriota bacterium]